MARAAPVYAALGASDAIGVGASNYPSQPNNGYVYLIHGWLQARYPPWVLKNFGASGYTVTNVRDVELSPAIEARPGLVTLWVGGNDVKDSVLAGEDTATLKARFEDAFATIIRRLRTETGAFIVTANLPDMSRIPVAAFLDAAHRQVGHDDCVALNEVIARVAAEYNVPVLDLYADPETYNPANYSWDGFHPNDAGYARMAAGFEAVLQSQAWRIVSGLGDVDGDGAVSAMDAARTLEATGGLSALAERSQVAADTSPAGGDGHVDAADAVQTLRRSLGIVPDAEWW